MHSSISSRDFDISYRVEGQGPPLVLLHGWSRWADDWWDAGYGDTLVIDYRVIALDWLGHGESDKPHNPIEYSEEPMMADIVAVLDAEHVDRALVWGYSMGARHAATLAVLEPSRVAALVCGGGAPTLSQEGRREGALDRAESLCSTEKMEASLRAMGSLEESIVQSMAMNDAVALSAAIAGTADWTPTAEDVRAPRLWYEGSNDEPFSPADLERAAQLGVETHLIPGADHVASFRMADEVLTAVQPFLERHRSLAPVV